MASSLEPVSPESSLSSTSSSTPTAQSEWPFPCDEQHFSSEPSTPDIDRRDVFVDDELEGIMTPPRSVTKTKRYHKSLKKSFESVSLDRGDDDESSQENVYSMHSPKSSYEKDVRSRHYRSTHQDGSHSSKHPLKFARTVATQTPSTNACFTCRKCRRTRRSGSEHNGSPQRSSSSRQEASGAVARRGSWGCASSAWQQVGRELLLIADDISRSSGSLNSNRGGSSDSNESIWRFLIRSGFRLGASVVAAASADDTIFRRRCSSMGALGGHYRRRTSH